MTLEKAGGGPSYGFYQCLFWVGYGYFPSWLGPVFMMANPLKQKFFAIRNMNLILKIALLISLGTLAMPGLADCVLVGIMRSL